MKLIDMHCDTAMKLLSQPEMDLCNPSLEVNLPALIQAHSMVEFFACFTDFQSYAAPPTQAYDYGYQCSGYDSADELRNRKIFRSNCSCQ
jgi:microsomal dipeptidase-like Zn-dependent dipeptidase